MPLGTKSYFCGGCGRSVEGPGRHCGPACVGEARTKAIAAASPIGTFTDRECIVPAPRRAAGKFAAAAQEVPDRFAGRNWLSDVVKVSHSLRDAPRCASCGRLLREGESCCSHRRAG